LISRFKATAAAAPNFGFRYSLSRIRPADLEGVSLASLEVILNGAEPVDPAAIAEFEETFGSIGLRRGVVRPVYGLAESTLAVTFTSGAKVDSVDAAALETGGKALPASLNSQRVRRFVSVGRPIYSQEVAILGPDDHPLAERCVGEVAVRGPSVMKGYFRRPAESADALRNGWLHTGDLGYLAEGELYLSGRIRDLVIRHGRNYHAQDLEADALRLEGAMSAVVFSLEEEDDPKVVLVVETRLREAEARFCLEREIRSRWHDAFLFGPDEICLVLPGAIPRTTSGKVRRQECKRLYQAGEYRSAAAVAV
jgi:acyl-CoA synthetase (AMP-forming)/AMP-acid ligase II